MGDAPDDFQSNTFIKDIINGLDDTVCQRIVFFLPVSLVWKDHMIGIIIPPNLLLSLQLRFGLEAVEIDTVRDNITIPIDRSSHGLGHDDNSVTVGRNGFANPTIRSKEISTPER